jgi:hypothetical protein
VAEHLHRVMRQLVDWLLRRRSSQRLEASELELQTQLGLLIYLGQLGEGERLYMLAGTTVISTYAVERDQRHSHHHTDLTVLAALERSPLLHSRALHISPKKPWLS